MERKPIRRGGIKSAGYDRNNRVLEIEFDNGSIIQHTAVGEEIARRRRVHVRDVNLKREDADKARAKAKKSADKTPEPKKQ